MKANAVVNIAQLEDLAKVMKQTEGGCPVDKTNKKELYKWIDGVLPRGGFTTI